MALLYPRLGVDYGGASIYYFPPFGGDHGPSVICVGGAKTETLSDPLTDGASLASSALAPLRFTIEGEIREPTAGDARSAMEAMRSALAGDARGLFRFFRFHDAHWRDCFVERADDLRFDLTRDPAGVIGYRARFVAGDPTLRFEDTIGPGPSEGDLYTAEEGSAPMSVAKQKTGYSVMFAGLIQPTPTGADRALIPEGASGDTLTVVSIQATCGQLAGASGATVLRVGRDPIGGSTTHSIVLSLPHDAASARNTGAFTIAAGESLYVFCESAGGHQDVMVNVVVEG